MKKEVDKMGCDVIDSPMQAMTATGLGITDTCIGSGDEATFGDLLVMHYTGQLEDGTVFDSSLTEGRDPFIFVLGAGTVIAGWEEGILGMQVGGTRTLEIPADLAYGEAGAGELIPPGATLSFDVELLDTWQSGMVFLSNIVFANEQGPASAVVIGQSLGGIFPSRVFSNNEGDQLLGSPEQSAPELFVGLGGG